MASQEHLNVLKQGVEIWNQWREEHLEIEIDLSGVNFNQANLAGVNFYQVSLTG